MTSELEKTAKGMMEERVSVWWECCWCGEDSDSQYDEDRERVLQSAMQHLKEKHADEF